MTLFLDFLEPWRRRLRMVKSSGQFAEEWDEDIEMNPRKKKEKKKRDLDIDIIRKDSLRFMRNKVYSHVRKKCS